MFRSYNEAHTVQYFIAILYSLTVGGAIVPYVIREMRTRSHNKDTVWSQLLSAI